MRFVYSVLLLSSVLISGCTDPAQQNQPNVYYDVLGYVKGQITDLSTQKPIISKTVAINEKRNQQTTRDINWSRANVSIHIKKIGRTAHGSVAHGTVGFH